MGSRSLLLLGGTRGVRDSWKLRQNGRFFFFLVTNNGFSILGARGFSCAVSGFGQVLKSDLRGFAARVFGLRLTKRSSPSHTRKNRCYPGYGFFESRERKGAIHSTKIPTGPTGKRGPPQKVDPFFRNFSGWTEPIH